MMNTYKTGELIKERRKQKGWTQKDLADRLCVTDRAVSKWERGINAPDISLLEPLAQALEITTMALITGDCTSNALTATEQEAMTKDIVRQAEDMVKRRSRTFFRRMITVILLVGVVTAGCKLWLWWPRSFEPLMNVDGEFRIDYRPVSSARDERQIYTFSANDPATAAIQECFQRYNWHYDFVMSFLYSNTIPAYTNHLLSPKLDGDVLVIYNLSEDGAPGDMVMTFASEANWFFLNGNMVVLAGPRGDQNGASLIAELKTCTGLQA